jgi:DNA-binding MltR family transcriptional regulator
MPEMTTGDKIEIVVKQAEAGNALVIAGFVDDWLQKLLLTAGRELSGADAERIFTGMGPLASFSGKIEIAYLFSFIDKAARDDLHLIRRIRNNFAHTSRFINFGSDHIVKDCRKLSNWKDGMDAQTCYRDKAFECVDLIKAKTDSLLMAQAVRAEPAVIMDDA